MKRRYYTIKEERFIVENYETMTQPELCQKLNRTAASIACKVRMLGLSKTTNKGQFHERQTPWNRGKRHQVKTKTQFRKGDLPATAKPENEMYLRKDHEAKNMLWYLRPAGQRRVVAYHRFRWEQLNGEIPQGHVVSFRDGNTMNIADENLVLKSRAQLARENHAKCDRKAAGEKAWATRCGLSAVDRVLMCVG